MADRKFWKALCKRILCILLIWFIVTCVATFFTYSFTPQQDVIVVSPNRACEKIKPEVWRDIAPILYSKPYTRDSIFNCEWFVTGPEDGSLEFVVNTNYYNSQVWAKLAFRVWDDRGELFPVEQSYRSPNATYTSTGNHISIEYMGFSSMIQAAVVRKILRKDYQGTKPPTTTTTTTTTTTSYRHVSACGPPILFFTGSIKSPNFPSQYNNYANCEWRIFVNQDSLVRLHIQSYEIEFNFDLLEITDPETSETTRLTGSKDTPTILVSTGNRLNLRFTSDHSVTKRGFRIEFSGVVAATFNRTTTITPTISELPTTTHPITITEGCGETNLTDSSGTIKSPNYPGNYGNNDYCHWNITVEPGLFVHLRIHGFKLEYRYDFLRVYDPELDNFDPVLTLNGHSSSTRQYTSTGNTLELIFTSDYAITDQGFLATYTTVTEHVTEVPTETTTMMTTTRSDSDIDQTTIN